MGNATERITGKATKPLNSAIDKDLLKGIEQTLESHRDILKNFLSETESLIMILEVSIERIEKIERERLCQSQN